MQKISSPVAGLLIRSLSAAVIRGTSIPRLVDFTSSMAELSGALLSLLMPVWACSPKDSAMQHPKTVNFFMVPFFMGGITPVNQKFPEYEKTIS